MRERLSVALITRDEEDEIRACLESVKGADEIVICDSGSVDRTVAICREYTDRVYVDSWQGYAGQKNLCLARTSSPWVLSLDADERVTPELWVAIERILEGGARCDGYYIPSKNFFLGRQIKHGGWYPDYKLRLFRRARGRFAERAVHESVAVDGKVGYLNEPLEHHSYRSLSEYLVKMDRYTTLGAEDLYRSGRRSTIFDLAGRPPFTFFKMYLFQGGLLDGWRGLILSGLYACYTFVKYAKLHEKMLEK